MREMKYAVGHGSIIVILVREAHFRSLFGRAAEKRIHPLPAVLRRNKASEHLKRLIWNVDIHFMLCVNPFDLDHSITFILVYPLFSARIFWVLPHAAQVNTKHFQVSAFSLLFVAVRHKLGKPCSRHQVTCRQFSAALLQAVTYFPAFIDFLLSCHRLTRAKIARTSITGRYFAVLPERYESRQENPRREYLPCCQGALTQYRRISARQGRACPCQSMVKVAVTPFLF